LGDKVSGKPAPDALNPFPLSVAAFTVTYVVPVERRTSDWAAVEFTPTLPKERAVALTASVDTDAPSCKAKLSALLLVVAVSITVVAVVTVVAAAVNAALLDPAGISTVAGTVTAAELLARLTLIPPVGAAPFSVTVQASVADPVKEPFAQLNEESSGRIAIVPEPLSAIAIVPPFVALLVTVNTPFVAPVVVGLNCTLTTADCCGFKV
jgi:hypothetical protein